MSGRTAVSILLSGGVDSTTLCYFLSQRHDVHPLFVDYGQRAASRERLAAKQVCNTLGVPLREVHFSALNTFGAGEILGRNLFLLSAALISLPPSHKLIAIGIHSGTAYYDCSQTFLERLNQLVAEHTNNQVAVIAPFVEWSKLDVYKYALMHSLPLALTYSCEAGESKECGICNSCLDREALSVSQASEH